MRLNLPADIPEKNGIIHASRCNIFTGGMEIERHDRFFMPFERSDETGVLFVMHECIFKL